MGECGVLAWEVSWFRVRALRADGFPSCVLGREFAKEKARAQKSGEFQKFREKQMVDEAYNGYLDWIAQAGGFLLQLIG